MSSKRKVQIFKQINSKFDQFKLTWIRVTKRLEEGCWMLEALSFKDITHNFEYQLIFFHYAKAFKIFTYLSIPLSCLKTNNYRRIHVKLFIIYINIKFNTKKLTEFRSAGFVSR